MRASVDLVQPSENVHRPAHDEGTRRIALRPARWLRDAAVVLVDPNAGWQHHLRVLILCSDAAKGAVLEAAVLAAVAGLGYPVKDVTIFVPNLSCGVPDASGIAPPCPLPGTLPTGYVSFVGTDKTAVVKIGTVTGGPEPDAVVSFEVPPPGPSF